MKKNLTLSQVVKMMIQYDKKGFNVIKGTQQHWLDGSRDKKAIKLKDDELIEFFVDRYGDEDEGYSSYSYSIDSLEDLYEKKWIAYGFEEYEDEIKASEHRKPMPRRKK